MNRSDTDIVNNLIALLSSNTLEDVQLGVAIWIQMDDDLKTEVRDNLLVKGNNWFMTQEDGKTYFVKTIKTDDSWYGKTYWLNITKTK